MRTQLYNVILSAAIVAASTVSVHAQFINTVAGNGTAAYTGDGGTALLASFNGMEGMAVDGAGNIYLADKNNHVIRKIANTGVVSTFAGTGVAGFSGNGGAATLAKLNQPSAVATDGAGNVYIADKGNNVVRVVDASGIIRKYAGNGIEGYSGDNDTAHLGTLSVPTALHVDGAGNLYIAEGGSHVIRKVDAGTHIMHTVAGTGGFGFSGDGGAATAASFNTPSGVAVDAAGNIYIADALNHRVRKVDAATGIVNTFAGTGTPGNSGNAGPATAANMSYPVSVALDVAGNMYVAERGFHNVRMVNNSGTISPVAGSSTPGYSGDGGLATVATLRAPRFVFVDGWNRIYIGDQGNNVLRQLSATAAVGNQVTTSGQFKVYPVPANNNTNLDLTAMTGAVEVRLTNVAGATILSKQMIGGQVVSLSLDNVAPGTYMVTATHMGKTYSQRVIKTAQ